VVAAARLTVWAGGAAALLAAGFIAALAFTGERPEPGLERFHPAGVLAAWPTGDIASVEIVAGAERRLFRRGPAGAWVGAGSNTAQRIETGLTLLRNTAPQRIFAAGEIDHGGLAEFALDPPRLTVIARTRTGKTVTIWFGDVNPLGLARYAQTDSSPEVLLLPSYVAAAWEEIATPQ